MRQRSFIVLAAALAVLVVGAVGVYAYDRNRDDVIAKGVTAGGVELSGLRPAAARDTLNRELARPLKRSIVVSYRGERYTLGPAQAKVRIDAGGMVRQALAASRTGNLIARTTRAITGGSVRASIPVRVTYSKGAVSKFVRRVDEGVDRPARDATISFSGGRIEPVGASTGRALDAQGLKRDVSAELVQPTADHRVRAPVREVRAKVTTAELGRKYPKVIVVDRGAFKLSLYTNLKLTKTYRIAVGMAGLETPAGEYRIQNKQVDPVWNVPNRPWAGSLAGKSIPPGPDNPLKARWMGFAEGAGIHGTSDIASLGTAASHGCIRMSVPDVKELFDRVEVGDPVYVS